MTDCASESAEMVQVGTTQCCGPWLQSETDRKRVRKSANLPTGFGTVLYALYQQNGTRLTKCHKPPEWILITP